MPLYEFYAEVRRTTEETYEIIVEAATPLEALDLVESTLETFPHSRDRNVRQCLKVESNTVETEIVDVEPRYTDGQA